MLPLVPIIDFVQLFSLQLSEGVQPGTQPLQLQIHRLADFLHFLASLHIYPRKALLAKCKHALTAFLEEPPENLEFELAVVGGEFGAGETELFELAAREVELEHDLPALAPQHARGDLAVEDKLLEDLLEELEDV